MPYPLKSQLTKDIDYYLIDRHSQKYHFASAGGLLPQTIVDNYRINREVHFLAQDLPPLFEFELNSNLDEIINFEDDASRNYYLRDFIFYARRGFVSFDRTKIGDPNDTNYHLVAKPGKSIRSVEEDKIKEKLKEYLLLDNEVSLGNNLPFKFFEINRV